MTHRTISVRPVALGGGGSGRGQWRTRSEAVAAGAGRKYTPPADRDSAWVPWRTLLDAREAPYFRWFQGARTNACFNAVDRHLLDGRGADVAITCLPEDPTRSPTISATRRELAGAVATAAVQLRDVYKLRPRDRVLFHMPTDAVHFVYMLACQRLVGPADIARRVIDTHLEPSSIESEGII